MQFGSGKQSHKNATLWIKNLEDYTTDLGKTKKYLEQKEQGDSSTSLLGIKQNTDFPTDVELYNNHTENSTQIFKQKNNNKQADTCKCRNVKNKRGQVS